MILTKYVLTKVGSNNAAYWKSKGYEFPAVGGKNGKNGYHKLKVKVEDLHPLSGINISCQCDQCGKKYNQRFYRNKDTCGHCRNSIKSKGNTYGKANKGKVLPHMRGENHPRWNPYKSEYKAYAYEVRRITEENYKLYKDIINPSNHPRTLCGVEDGYQLDHVVSIQVGFDLEIEPSEIGALDNLQMLSWEENSAKR